MIELRLETSSTRRRLRHPVLEVLFVPTFWQANIVIVSALLYIQQLFKKTLYYANQTFWL